MARKSYHHGNPRLALIAAGLKILNRKGVAAMTLRAVAAEAGVSPAAPYRHFVDATALAAAIAEEGFIALRASIEAALVDPAWRRHSAIERSGQGYVRFALTHPDHHRLMFSGRIAPSSRGPSLESAGRAAFDRLVSTIAEARLAGLISEDTPSHLLAIAAWSLVHGLSTLLIEGFLDLDELGLKSPADLVAACQEIFRTGWSA